MRIVIGLFMLLLASAAAPPPNHQTDHKVILSEPSEVERFMAHMARRESNNNYQVVNRYGMMGRYQFSPRTVKALGFDIDKHTFLSNPYLQDTVMLALMRANNKELSDYIRRYEGRSHKGVLITRAGVLAGAHLCGSNDAKKFFIDPLHNGCIDANGTTIRHYIKELGSYNLGENF